MTTTAEATPERITTISLDELDNINSKLQCAMATLDMFRSFNIEYGQTVNIDSIATLAYRAYNELQEVLDFLNPDTQS